MILLPRSQSGGAREATLRFTRIRQLSYRQGGRCRVKLLLRPPIRFANSATISPQ